MNDRQRLAYLEALEIPVWVSRGHPAVAADMPAVEAIQRGPGTSATLLICGHRDQSSSPLSSDIARVLPDTPVWAWPSEPATGQSVGDTVQEALFTAVLVFGHALAGRLFGATLPERVGSARIVVAEDLDTLGNSPDSRRELWRQLCAGGMVKAP